MKRLLLYIFLIAASIGINAQNENAELRNRYNIAYQHYYNGMFDVCEEEFSSLLPKLKGQMKTEAYHALALCRLEKGDVAGARTYVSMLLNHDPYFTVSINDSQRLSEIVDEFKNKASGITTASRQAEAIEDAPVPVTLITEDMIRHSGAQTMQDLLCLYVPGMSLAEGIGTNIAMHGVYGLSQEKILFLQDGHRLNGATTNEEAPDYRNSLDKIHQIEVLRGPASSLYGNVALTAVVNIITKKGAQMNGGRVSGTIGTQKSYGCSFVLGGGNNVVDLLGWGSIYNTEGFKHTVVNNAYNEGTPKLSPVTTLYSHGYNRRPSYDIGIKGRWRKFTMTFNSQRSKRVPYNNLLQLPATQKMVMDGLSINFVPIPDFDGVQNFNYDKYPSISSDGPGITRTNHHLNIDYSHSFGKVDFQASGFVSMEHINFHNVMGDSIEQNIGYLLLSQIGAAGSSDKYSPEQQAVLGSLMTKTSGVFQVMEWENITFGGNLQLLANYSFLGKGSAMFGVQMEHFALTNSNLFLCGDYSSRMMISSGKVLADGYEDMYSTYAQLKHLFTPRFILNAGLRFDHKERFSSEKLNHFSPRLSLIYKFTDAFSARGSYNYSFVDAPYLYRANAIPLFSGGPDLKPEIMKSYQVSTTWHKPNSPFTAEISGFVNKVKDLITLSMRMKGGKGQENYLFYNTGNMTQLGFEGSATYQLPYFLTTANLTWQKAIKSEDTYVYKDNQYGVPAIMANANVAYEITHGGGSGLFGAGKLWTRANIHFQGDTYYRTVDVLNSFKMQEDIAETTKVEPLIVASIGLGYEWKYLDIDISLKNITNNQYKIGSMLTNGVPHAGRQLLAKITFKI